MSSLETMAPDVSLPSTIAPAPPTSCPTCSGATAPPAPARAPVFVYALGRIEPRFPRISVEREFAQATGQADTKGLTDHQVLHKVLSDPHNRYLVRQLCWVMHVAGLETYLLSPRHNSDVELLVETLRPTPDRGAIDAVIGVRGPVAPPDMCNGLSLPMVIVDQVYPFDRDSLIKAIPRPAKVAAQEFTATAEEVLERILAATDNAGATDEHRALNYLALRDPGIYARAAECYSRDLALTGMGAHPWRLSASRKVVEVVFTFTQRKNEFVEHYAARVDVQDEFPFLVSKLAPYYQH